MIAVISSLRPIILGLWVDSNFMGLNVQQTGLWTMSNNKNKRGGHAVLIVGYDEVQDLWLVRNYWGTKWGINGHFCVSTNVLLSVCLEMYTGMHTTDGNGG